ncbi:hypothetical protein FRC98_10495 [Lujinxingia vulgaris]|uniref:General stress protein 17M-like domain-containing protein n=1 Tax=Lujinxingia vulgaris TaxID=2600176 RepID=A0A5C6XEA7_9DELT|nr:hypothetical protein [Lujinxingia vulgaris]TXD37153.1 hypothetical protein FRC98_10495 [Lujinxingia vulgaris]
MHTLILALYENKERANDTIDELKDAGIKGLHIDHIASPGTDHSGIFKGLFSGREDSQKDARESLEKLTERGISETEARRYASGVRQGYDLLIVDLDDDTLAHSARQIMDRRAYAGHPTSRQKLGQKHTGGIIESATSEGISTSSLHDEHPSRTDRPASGVTSAQSSPHIPHSSEVTSGTQSTTHEPRLAGSSTVAGTAERPAARNDVSRFDSSFREHYQRNFADSRYAYEDFALAYRYGVALAEEPRYENNTWDQVEPMAHQSWETRETGPWPLFRDAIRFGWNRIRGEHQSEPLPPRL